MLPIGQAEQGTQPKPKRISITHRKQVNELDVICNDFTWLLVCLQQQSGVSLYTWTGDILLSHFTSDGNKFIFLLVFTKIRQTEYCVKVCLFQS